jgi:hypothetical protein
MFMKKGFYSLVLASAVLGASSIAFAGAYGEAEQPEEIPAPAPAPPAPEPPPAKVHRKHVGFLTDSETTRGLRGELGAFYAAEYHDNAVGDVDAVNTYAHISYGTELFEVGVFAPLFIWTEQDSIPGDRSDFGDLSLWAKVIPLRMDNFTLGGGLIATFPTAGDGLGTDEYGFEPFLTAGFLAGPVDLRASFGYIVTTAPDLDLVDPDTELPISTPSDLYDRTDLNVAALYPVAENVVVRGELVHQHWVGSFKEVDPVSIFPGVDVSFPLGSVDLVLRPTLGIGIHHAPDWQIGLGIAVEAPQL